MEEKNRNAKDKKKEKSKTTTQSFKLPYPQLEWPIISPDSERMILGQLCTLISPIGDHRRQNVTLSRGKGRKKRKRHANILSTEEAHKTSGTEMPGLFHSLTIGFNSTVRCLEAIAQSSKPPLMQHIISETPKTALTPKKICVLFCCRSVLPDLLTASIPTLVAIASQAQPGDPPIRLVALPSNAETELARALNQPRVGFLGVTDKSNADVLIGLVRSCIEPVKVLWLQDLFRARHLLVEVATIEATVGSKNKTQKPKSPPRSP